MSRNILMPIMSSMTNYYHKIKSYTGTNPVPKSVSPVFLFLVILITALLTSSCEQKTTEIGMGLLPLGDFTSVTGTDTISVEAYTVYSDSAVTNNKTYSYLGGLYDPYLGNITADFVAQLRLTEKWAGKGAFEIDSVKLSFSILGAKGDLSVVQELQIYEIDEELSPDSVYYSNKDPDILQQLAIVELPLVEKDTATSFTLDLPVSFGQHLLRDTVRLNQEDTETDFRKFFKGVYITLGEVITKAYQPPMLMTMQFESGNFVITIYYHYLSDGSTDSYLFYINANSARYNRYLHDYSTAAPEKQIIHIGEQFRDTITGLQPFNGVSTKINLPGLEYFKTINSISVNKARIYIPVFLDDDTYTEEDVPTNIYMFYKDLEGVRYYLPDYLISPLFFDGSFDSGTGKFSFNIASFVQEYLNGNIPSTELELYIPDGEYKNIILKANDASDPSTFEFVFTRY